MWRSLAILAVLGTLATVGLVAGQTAPLGPPKQGITESSGGQSGKTQAKPQSGNQTTPNPLPPSPQPTAPTCDEACQQSRQNLDIQRKLEWFTGVLAFVGVLQVGSMVWQALLLKQTRGDVHAQANWMKKQAGYMARQALSMRRHTTLLRKSADAADISAKAAMGAAVPHLMLYALDFGSMGVSNFEAKLQRPRIKMTLKNYGQTPAFLKSYAIQITCQGMSDNPTRLKVIHFAHVVAIEFGKEFTQENIGPMNPFSVEEVAAIVKGDKKMTVSGWYRYGDLFGTKVYEMPFSKFLMRYSPKCFWADSEYVIENQPPNPN